MKRLLPKATFDNKLKLFSANGVQLSKVELMALTRCINHKCSDAQAQQLVWAAEGCNIVTPLGLLVGFESFNCMVNGTKWRPVFKQNLAKDL